jgi:DNA replication and repair protein RecF
MKLERLRLVDFRNYRDLDLSFDESWVLLAGANAQGKTNILEAISLVCVGHSPRRAAEIEMIRWGQERARVAAHVASDVRGELELETTLTGAGREIRLNGAARRVADLIGVVGLVTFTVDDLDIVKRDPFARRRFVDTELGALSRSYYWNLVRYRRVVDQRNRLLKAIRDSSRKPAELESWNAQLTQFGAVVVEKRAGFIKAVAAAADGAFRKLAGGPAGFELRYHPALGEEQAWPKVEAASDGPEDLRRRISERLARALAESRGRELEFGATQCGPHRDDFDIIGGGVDLHRFGSQGEQRTAAIALRLGLMRVVTEAVGEPPLLLLDDVLSELDAERRAGLFEALGAAGQTIVTATELDAIPTGVRAAARVWEVANGAVAPLAWSER